MNGRKMIIGFACLFALWHLIRMVQALPSLSSALREFAGVVMMCGLVGLMIGDLRRRPHLQQGQQFSPRTASGGTE